MDFIQKLEKAIAQNYSCLCVGLDPNIELLPSAIRNRNASPTVQVKEFLTTIVEVTQDYCAAYKPNLGFFEALGPDGWDIFQEILEIIPSQKIVIADAKRGDISSTAHHYAQAFFKKYRVDAVTLNPLMGFETLDPFLHDPSKGIYVLTLTSNPGAKDLLLQPMKDGKTLSSHISTALNKKQSTSKTVIGMVVGATQTSDLHPVITRFSSSPLLIPGIGKQGGSLKELNTALQNHRGLPLINASRSIIYAGNDTSDWKMEVSHAAQALTQKLSPITERYVAKL